MTEGRTAAFFDVDGTLLASTIVHYYAWLRERSMRPWQRPFWRMGFLCKCLYFMWLDKGGKNRTGFNDYFYRSYAGMNAAYARQAADACFHQFIKPKLFPDASACLAQHRRENHLVVLVTGSLDFLMSPLADHLDIKHVEAPGLEEQDGVFTGRLTTPAVAGLEKANRINAFAERENVDLGSSFAYGDSTGDLPMLECVGRPVVVNPDKRLRRVAEEREWAVTAWKKQA